MKFKGAYIRCSRCRVIWIKYGDKCASYFLNKEKKTTNNYVIEKIGENDKYVYDDNDNLGALCNFCNKYTTINILKTI